MTFEEFYQKVLALFPGAYIGEDNDGQLIVYTGMERNGHEVVDMD